MSEVVDKWGKSVAERGFSQIPNYLLHLNQFVAQEDRLSPVELLVLIELASSWWKKDEQPYPSMKTLATRCGTSERQILRAISKLEDLDMLKRVKRRTRGIISSNAYDLLPLVEVLKTAAEVYPPDHPRKVQGKKALGR